MNRFGYKVLSDSTLMPLSKKKLIELLRVAEHNFFVTDEALDNSVEAGKKYAELVTADTSPKAKTITRQQFKEAAERIGRTRGNTSEKVHCAFFAVDLEIALFGDYEDGGVDDASK